jgi:hypothetical protein
MKMRIIGRTLSAVESLVIDEMAHPERKCAYCQRQFDPADRLVVLFITEYSAVDEIALPSDAIYILHIKNPLNKEQSCLEEFIAQSIIVPIAEGGEKPVEIAEKSEEIGPSVEASEQPS